MIEWDKKKEQLKTSINDEESKVILKIIETRLNKGLSYKDFSELTNINLKTLVGIETLQIKPSREQLDKILSVLGIK
jgi:transcriptional regulator with XRE-family HTH domain